MPVSRIVVAAVALSSAALALAGPAAAAPPSGNYTATVTSASGMVPTSVGETMVWALTPCGADCTHLEINPPNARGQEDLHLQAGSWVGGVNPVGCTRTINADVTSATEACGANGTVQYAITRNG